jgi:hypothetical protein
VIVSGGRVWHEGRGRVGESEELAVKYTLSDSGASHKFVSRELIGRLEAKGVQFMWREKGSMRVTTARETVLVPFRQVQLTLALGGSSQGAYTYTGSFVAFNLAQDNLILGKNFMQEVEHHINHHENALYLDWDETTKRLRHKLQGLERGSTAETHISMVCTSTREPLAAPTVANANVPNVPNVPISMVSASTREPPTIPMLPKVNVPDVTDMPNVPKKRKQRGMSGGVRHRRRDTSFRVVEEA